LQKIWYLHVVFKRVRGSEMKGDKFLFDEKKMNNYKLQLTFHPTQVYKISV